MRGALKIFFIIFVMAGCSKKDNPITPEETGKIVVMSNPSGAVIVVDGKNTGRLTPDSLEIGAGEHLLKLYLLGFKAESTSFILAKGERKEFRFELAREERMGWIVVSSFPEGASIYVDFQNSEHITPDTVQVGVGEHLVSVELSGFISEPAKSVVVEENQYQTVNFTLSPTKGVLIEEFSNVSCQACVQTGRFVRSIVNGIGQRAILVSYHTRFPNPYDPFYMANPVDNQARSDFYSVSSAPDLFIDGTRVSDPTDSALATEIVSNELNLQSDIGFTATLEFEPEEVSVSLGIYAFRDVAGDLYAVLVEDWVHYEVPPGSNGERDFYGSMRKFVRISYIVLAARSFEQKNFTIHWAGVNRENFSVIVFVQESTTKRVLQAWRFQ